MVSGANLASDVIFCGPRKDYVAQCECLASEFGLRKLFSKRKKSFKLVIRENSDYRRNEDIYF